MSQSERFRVTWTAGSILLALGVLTVAPLYLLTGQPTGYLLAVPVWGWALFAIHVAMLGGVVLFIKQLGGVDAIAGGER